MSNLTQRDVSEQERVRELVRELFRQAAVVAGSLAAASGMHPTDVNAMRALDAAAGEPVTVSRLGAELGLSSGAVTALVDRLERHGMVTRTRDVADRRRVHVALTDKAHGLGAELLRPIGARIEHAVTRLDRQEIQTVERFLAQVVGVAPTGRS